MKSNPPPLPTRARSTSTPGLGFAPAGSQPPPGVLVGYGGGAAPAAAAVMRGLPTPDRVRVDPVRISRPDGQDGSIPAYGNTLNFGAEDSVGDYDPRVGDRGRKSSVAVWLMAVLLTAAALGGIAFFAVKRGSFSNDPNHGTGASPDPGTSTSTPPSAIPPVVPPVQPTGMTSSVPDRVVAPQAPSEPADAAPENPAPPVTPTPPVATPTPPARVGGGFVWKPPSGGGGGHAPRTARPTTTGEAPTSEPARPTPPGLAADPFGTPE